jgi:hypothetical protein
VHETGPIMWQGYSGRIADTRTVQLAITPGDVWLYVERRAGNVYLYSGPACRQCQLGADGLTRCSRHAEVEVIAQQLHLL